MNTSTHSKPSADAKKVASQSEHISLARRAADIADSLRQDGSDSSSTSFCEDDNDNFEQEIQPRRRRPRKPPTARKAPARAMSMPSGIEDKMKRMADRDNRRASLKDQYRVDDVSSLAGGGRSTMGGSTSLSSSSTHNRRKLGSGLDAGPFNGFLNSTDDMPEKPARERRSSTIDGILTEAKNKKYEQKAKLGQQEVRVNNHYDEDMLGIGNGSYDQQRTKQKKEKGLQQIANLVITTAKLTRSAAKGSVNAVRDPKRAVKNVGHFTKDAAKGTVNVVRDPKKAAMNVTNLTTKTIKGTVKFGANVTNDVAKGGFKVTRTVAKGGLGATTMVVGRTTDGLGNVANGTAGFFGVKRGKGQGEDQAEYHAKDLPCRRKGTMSLMDRVTEVVDTSDEALITAATKQPNTSRTPASSSLLVPAAATPGRAAKMGSWDV
jgi:hypothetical protein